MTRHRLVLLSAILLTGAACTPTMAVRGNLVEDSQMAEIVAGLHTRSDVLSRLGSPTTVAPFDDNLWYYIGQETAKKGILDPKVENERIVTVRFNDAGTVLEVVDVDAERISLPIERSKTATHGNEITFLQQLLGNVGRFNPATQAGGSGL